MHYFGVELHSVKLLFLVFHCGNGACVGFPDDFKPFGSNGYVIGMAHPANVFLIDVFKDFTVEIFDIAFAVFSRSRAFDLTAERIRHELRAVTYSEDGYAEIENFGVDVRRIFIVNAVGSAREYYSHRIVFFNFFD